jgi:hypothetical protein
MDKHRFHGLALDSEYRDRYQLYYLSNGTISDSRLINWRQLEWEKVVKVETYIRDKKWIVDCSDPRFEFFIIFRWFGREFIDGKPRTINYWTQGWSDSVKCYLMDIDFKTGNLLQTYIDPISKHNSHVHPRVKDKTKKKKQHFGTFFNKRKGA